jgi:hypothetical protein
VIANFIIIYKMQVELRIKRDFECLLEINMPFTITCLNFELFITLYKLCFLSLNMRKQKFNKLKSII